MKRAIQFLFLLALFFFRLDVFAQELPGSQKFPIGSFIGAGHDTDPQLYSSFIATGMNTIAQYADENTKPFMTNLDVIALNQNNAQDYIFYYATCYYSKWESENVQTDKDKVGVKHKYGQMATWITGQDTLLCWSSLGLTSPADSLVYGPHYRQEKYYKRWYNDLTPVYRTRFNMALDYTPETVNPNENVCVIKVKYRYAEVLKFYNPPKDTFILHDTVFVQDTLKISDFNEDGLFKYFELPTYAYPSKFGYGPVPEKVQIYNDEVDTSYTDSNGDNGIQFCVDWLRDNNLCTLYIDCAEVYDQDGWDEYLEPTGHQQVLNNIQTYLQPYSDSDWPNLKYWYSHDEPYTQDAYTPMHIVDSLVQSFGGSPLITYFYPYWGITVNGDSQLVKYYNMVQPEKLMIDYYPMSAKYDIVRWEDLESTRQQFQIAHSLQPGFWYVGQGYGFRLYDNSWCVWRKPESAELSATIMLALAHGSKGIMFWNYDSYQSSSVDICAPYLIDALVDEQLNPTYLYNWIKDNLAPRLNGSLGSTLLNIDYTGDYLPLKRFTDPTYLPPAHFDYLTMTFNHNGDCNFHTGFLENSNQPDNKYFLTANILTTSANAVNISVTKPNENFINYRFRNVESQFDYDTTFNSSLNIDYDFPAGEGYLFQVAPVVLYGGRLLYNESVTNGMTLLDDMTIENSATLTVTGTYYANADITVKDGGSIKTVDGGEIKFASGRKLIIEGLATVKGTSSQNLTLDFNDQELIVEGSGIQVNLGSDFTLSYCLVKNSSIGLSVVPPEIQPAFQNLNINNSTFDNCGTAININGNPVINSKVKNCLIINSSTGIVVTNNNKITIQSNTITNADLGIFLEFTSNTHIIGNHITSTLKTMPGVMMSSSGGQIRTNTITGHTIGISLANSSPKIGGNTITGNLINGIYITVDSNPDLRPALAGDPPNMFPLSGYNLIYDNGGYQATTLLNDDGSEIFINDGFIRLGDGCNQIMDDRNQGQNLIETLLLMNSNPLIPVSTITADTNYWSEINYDPSGRFGNLTINYIPYLTEPCIIPQAGGQMLVVQSTNGEVIDTVYSNGIQVGTLSGIDALYAAADNYYVTAQTEQAKAVYEQIINDYPGDPNSLYAYIADFMITRLSGDSSAISYFRSMLQQKLNTITDTLLAQSISQLSAMCLIDEQNFSGALSYFEEIINNHPNTDAALFAEIDALTTSMIAGLDSTQLGKGKNQNLLVKNTSDYLGKVNNLLKGRFGYQKPEEEKIIPEQYFLYQNYPNPFNPTTSIKFDLPQAGNVELIVYDILGRKVKQLLNETKPAGTYEITFNASSLASGVYIYKIQAGDFVSSKKMLMLK